MRKGNGLAKTGVTLSIDALCYESPIKSECNGSCSDQCVRIPKARIKRWGAGWDDKARIPPGSSQASVGEKFVAK